jgi:L-fuconolactonase
MGTHRPRKWCYDGATRPRPAVWQGTKMDLQTVRRRLNPHASMRLDSHQHFWHYNSSEHVWMTDAMIQLKRDFLPTDLKPLLDSIEFDGCVAVQARQNLEETRWLLELAEQHDFIKGVVGWVDLRSADVVHQLTQFKGNRKLVGVRHVVHDEPDARFLLQPDFVRGIEQLRAFGLCYDLLLFPKHLPVASELVRKFPEQAFVLDHLAKPPIASGETSPWREHLAELAGFPNVWCKLSGMVTEANWHQWRSEDFHQYLEIVFETFGPERLMIGSDWPVCTLASNYRETMNVVTNYVRKFRPEAEAQILGGNCARCYGLHSTPRISL